jgi:mono/diheme cytochrome c family protein
MTYQARSGRQFVVVATGGGTDAGFVAFALKRGASATSAQAPAPPRSGATATAAAAPAADSVSGQAAYMLTCAMCHGRTGGGAEGPALVPMVRETEELLAIIREGRGEMPPMSARDVSDEHVSRIAEYLRTLKPGR